MQEHRPHRGGLGISAAITIRGDPGPSTRQRELFEAAQLDLAEQEWTPTEGQIWNEWNINPSRHGPERLNRLPTFVKSSAKYDELGRTALEGVEVEIDQGKRRKGKERAPDEPDVADWYKSLAQKNRPASRADSPKPVNDNPVIDLTDEGDDLEHEILQQTVQDSFGSTDAKPNVNRATGNAGLDSTSSHPTTAAPLRVHRSEWFIRRALLNRSRSEVASASSSPGPASISTMLKIEAKQPRVSQHRYVLGPDNKGYELLKSRHGWEGGGLGRPPDWEERVGAQSTTPPPATRGSEDKSPMVELDVHGEPVVDLTVDSDAEPEDDFADVEPLRQGGPGRTAPISTSLKLDRLGLGHQRNKRAARDAEKKVTHTIDEIRRVQQRSRYPPPKTGIELGKKGKIKWKELDKREREDRKRLLAALNA